MLQLFEQRIEIFHPHDQVVTLTPDWILPHLLRHGPLSTCQFLDRACSCISHLTSISSSEPWVPTAELPRLPGDLITRPTIYFLSARMTPHSLVYQTSGSMPSLFGSNASSRSRSLPGNDNGASPGGAYVRRSSATIDALTRGLRRRSEVEVILDGKNEFIRTYSTFDQIKGRVELKFERDTIIGDMIVFLEGQSQTYVEKIAAASPTTGRTTGRHTFLRVQQPISTESLPENMLAKANQVYSVPFTFVVPDRLLSHICTHTVDNDDTKAEHLHLPPSLGDPMLAGKGNVLMDDLAPDMAKIVYSIKARVGKASPTTGRLYDVEEKISRIRIVPAREETPPLSIDANNASFALRAEKNVRKGVFKIGRKLGRLTAEVAQPRSLRLPPISSSSSAPVTTMAAVTLRFDPSSQQEQPPQLGNLSAKIKAYTFFGAAAYKKIPESSTDSWSTLHGLYPGTVPLSCRNVGNVAWTKHEPGSRRKSAASQASAKSGITELSRRTSNLSTGSAESSSSTDSIPAASSAYDSSLPFYTARVLVPISLPQQNESDERELASLSKSPLARTSKKVIFVPTFHTCIISRSYTLELNLSFHPVNSAGNTTNALGGSSIALRSPIQVSQEASSLPPADDATAPLNLALIEGTDEYDEVMARRLDQELNFSDPFGNRNSAIDTIPEYEEVQTTFSNTSAARHASIAVPPSANTAREQPPEYFSSPFQNPGAAQMRVRRVSIRS